MKGTCYYEVDETEDSRTARKCARRVEDVNELSGVRVSSDSGKTNTWNITGDDEFLVMTRVCMRGRLHRS